MVFITPCFQDVGGSGGSFNRIGWWIVISVISDKMHGVEIVPKLTICAIDLQLNQAWSTQK